MKSKNKDWKKLSKEEKMALVEKVLDEEIRPYIAMDQGGLILLDIIGDFEVKIKYLGACVGCPAATSSTLYAIEGVLQEKIHPEIKVVPSLE